MTTTATASDFPAAPEALPHRQVLVVFGGLVLVMLLGALDGTIVSTALPTIVGELGGLERLSWVVTAYLLAQTVVTPIYGKLGDLYGRKRILQSAVVIFLVGSVLCGMSRTMGQLIAFRALQGLGGGGLIVVTQAVVGDIVPPRERGRYQGIFGAVFGVASIAGPLLGGFFTTQMSWRWIFYINVPIGLVAMVVLALTLPRAPRRAERAIDYAGAALLAVVLSSIVLYADLGGTTFPWSSPEMLGLIAAGVVALALFIAAERRAPEPVLPLRLFANRAFTVASVVGLVVGFALFGSVTYLPLYLQVVQGASPTASGLQMLPLMAGNLLTSIGSGQIISRTGRYRIFPIAGMALASGGLLLLSRVTPATPLLHTMGAMLLLGLGLGMVMQVLVIAVQNVVDYRDLGVATSGATLFRLVGGSLGTAILGAIFAARLSSNLARMLPPGTPGAGGERIRISSALLERLSPALRATYIEAFTEAMATIFLAALGVGLVGFLFAWLMPEHPLRRSIAATASNRGTETGEAFAMPTGPDARAQLLEGLSTIAERDVSREYIRRVVTRAGLDLSGAAAALVIRLGEDPHAAPAALAGEMRIAPERLDEALAELASRGMLVRGASPVRAELTDHGCAAFGRLADARRDQLREVFSEWSPERHDELTQLLRQVLREMVPEVRRA
ncbi:MAG TPA: MFS transporter [Gemmatimonadaceae bacterium]|nr:MFS transporter [Gemmatimonadaceae bacterium]